MRFILIFLFCFSYLASFSQPLAELPPVDNVNYSFRKKAVLSGATIAYSTTLIGLNELWYKQNSRQSFRFFNDNREWQQIDKIGHFYTCFELGRAGVEAMRWSGFSDKKAKIYGSMAGLLLMIPVEIMDGFSASYGASWGDIVANKAGAGLLLSQLLLWDEIRIQLKFSFHQTGMAPLRPNTLGSNLPQQILKDYNGQTYWLSINPGSFIKTKTVIPAWLNFSVGYGAEKMFYSDENINRSIGYDTYRQYYLALDVDFTRIKTNHKVLKKVFSLINGLHVPGPALSFDRKNGIEFRPFYF